MDTDGENWLETVAFSSETAFKVRFFFLIQHDTINTNIYPTK